MHEKNIFASYFKQKISQFGKKIRVWDLLKFEYLTAKDAVFIQIGANDGIRFDDLYKIVTTMSCRGYVVEPIDFYYRKLKENYKKFPNIVPLKLALHASEKKCKIFYADPNKLINFPYWSAGIGSFDIEHVKNHGIPEKDIVFEYVDSLTFNEFLLSYNIDKITYLQIDTEGYDSEIIKMIDFGFLSPNIIKFEHMHISRQQLLQLKRILKRAGYKLLGGWEDAYAIKQEVHDKYIHAWEADTKLTMWYKLFSLLGFKNLNWDVSNNELDYTMSRLFSVQPREYFQRVNQGDHFLLLEMKEYFRYIPLPESTHEVIYLLEDAFTRLTQKQISSNQPIPIKRITRAGSFNGHVSAQFWRDFVIPFLIKNFDSLIYSKHSDTSFHKF